MTRPAAPVIALSTGVVALGAAGLATLLWCAWLLVNSSLPLGATVAAWVLWLVAVAAATTLGAYVRELLRYRPDVAAGASWRPLPGLVLLWAAGLATLVAFPFMLPRGEAAAVSRSPGNQSAWRGPAVGSGEPTAGSSITSSRTPATAPTTVAGTADGRSGGDASAVGGAPLTPAPSGPPPAGPTSPATPTPSPTRTGAAASPTTSSTPLLGVTLPTRPGKRLGTLPHPTKR